MKINDLLTLGLVLVPFLFFGAQSITKQIDNLCAKKYNALTKWAITSLLTMLAVIIIIKGEFEDLNRLNDMNNYGVFIFAFGLSQVVAGGYDSVKTIGDAIKFKTTLSNGYEPGELDENK